MKNKAVHRTPDLDPSVVEKILARHAGELSDPVVYRPDEGGAKPPHPYNEGVPGGAPMTLGTRFRRIRNALPLRPQKKIFLPFPLFKLTF